MIIHFLQLTKNYYTKNYNKPFEIEAHLLIISNKMTSKTQIKDLRIIIIKLALLRKNNCNGN